MEKVPKKREKTLEKFNSTKSQNANKHKQRKEEITNSEIRLLFLLIIK